MIRVIDDENWGCKDRKYRRFSIGFPKNLRNDENNEKRLLIPAFTSSFLVAYQVIYSRIVGTYRHFRMELETFRFVLPSMIIYRDGCTCDYLSRLRGGFFPMISLRASVGPIPIADRFCQYLSETRSQWTRRFHKQNINRPSDVRVYS